MTTFERVVSRNRKCEVWFYGRYSSDQQHDRSIEQQLAESTKLCAPNTLPPPASDRRYGDRAKSGKSLRGREELARLLREAAQDDRGLHRVLVLEDLDRLGRNFFDSIAVADRLVRKLGFRILTCGGLDSEDADHF